MTCVRGPSLSVSSSLRVKFGNNTQNDEPVTGSGRGEGGFSFASALISVPCNRRAVPELPLTFLGCEFTCLVSAFRAQSKLACHGLISPSSPTNNSRNNSASQQPAIERWRTTTVSLLHLFLLTKASSLRSREGIYL